MQFIYFASPFPLVTEAAAQARAKFIHHGTKNEARRDESSGSNSFAATELTNCHHHLAHHAATDQSSLQVPQVSEVIITFELLLPNKWNFIESSDDL